MQYDMHYYGTYVIACSAGIPSDDAQIIAYSAQNVDDQNVNINKSYGDEKYLLKVATAHHPIDAGLRSALKSEYPENDARTVWVPFHFFPGGEGDSYEERMACVKDGKIIRSLLEHYLKSPFTRNGIGLQLAGIAAHVYADTFSHYDFIGIKSDRNTVRQDSIEFSDDHSATIIEYITAKGEAFFDKLKGGIAELSPLGHGSVNTMPDRPFLKFRFKFEDGRDSGWRDNSETFLEGCRALHEFFSRFARQRYASGAIKAVSWDKIEDAVKDVLRTEAKAEERVEAWLKFIKIGRFSCVSAPRPYIEGMLENDFEYNRRFHAAADYHRTYSLRFLMPEYGLNII